MRELWSTCPECKGTYYKTEEGGTILVWCKVCCRHSMSGLFPSMLDRPGLVRVPFDEAHWMRWCPENGGGVLPGGTDCEHGSVPCLVLVNPDRAALGEDT